MPEWLAETGAAMQRISPCEQYKGSLVSSFVEWARAEQELARRLEAGVAALERKALLFDVSNYSNAIVKSARQAAPIVIGREEFEASLEWLQRPVFICGHHRSGTTLLQELLDDHPQLAVLPVEVTYFASFADVAVDAFIAEWVARLIDVNGKLHFHLGRASHTHNPSFQFARALLAWHARLLRRSPGSGLSCAAACAGSHLRQAHGGRADTAALGRKDTAQRAPFSSPRPAAGGALHPDGA